MTETLADVEFGFEHSYANELPDYSVACQPHVVPEPRLLALNRPLANELGLSTEQLDDELAERIFSGNALPADAQPIAQAYAGHQFGGLVPQLGDGRALLLGEVIDRGGQRRDIALKGSGRTPFSRGGDGKAAVGPVLREYLIGEAMNALGVPTTRALAAVGTGEPVRRERSLPGAVLTRVAASHIRVGTFQFFAIRERHDQVKLLADYVIGRHDPQLQDDPQRYLELLKAVTERQARLLAQWMLIGFIHGVMNTDNMTISGETIDYGPCAFMEAFNRRAVFSSIDSGGRYHYANQPLIARWNLARFAETLVPLWAGDDIDKALEEATEVVMSFLPRYENQWLAGMRRKLGITAAESNDAAGDVSLAEDWLQLLEEHHVDFTLAWRRLTEAAAGGSGIGEDSPAATVESLFPDANVIEPWLKRWRERIGDPSQAAQTMAQVNPIFVPRNHRVEEALTAATERNDLAPFHQLLEVITRPYEQRDDLSEFAAPAPQEFTACYKTYCGT